MMSSCLKSLSQEELDIIGRVALKNTYTREWLLNESRWGRSKTDALVKTLADKKILKIGEMRGNGKGRSNHRYTLTRKLGYTIGIELNPAGDRIVLKDFTGDILAEEIEDNSIDKQDVPASLDRNISRVLNASSISWEDIAGIGIGVHGFIDDEKEIVRRFLYHNEEVCISFNDYFFHKYGVPVYISRPKYLVCLQEHLNTYIAERQNFINVNIGFGVGISLFIEGKYYSGFSGLAGEFGHLVVKENGKPCYCGNRGCLRTIASYRGICTEALSMIEEFEQEKVVHGIDKQTLEHANYEQGVEQLIDAALQQNKLSINLFYELGKTVGTALASVVTLVNPSILIIHTNLIRVGEYFTAPLSIALRRNALSFSLKDLKLEFTNLKTYSVAEGAAILAVMKSLKKVKTV
jgi:predicted NBD/HSP70 family sugar kinase